MDFLKKLFNEIISNPIVNNVITTLKPTEDWILNKGGLRIMFMAIPLFLLNIILSGVTTTVSLKLGGMIGGIIALIINVFIFIFVSMGSTIASLNAFDMLVNNGKKITFNEYVHIAKTNAISFSVKYLKEVAVYLIIITIAGSMLKAIPTVKGNTIATFIKSFLIYGLTFKMYASLLGRDGEKEALEKKNYWLIFALAAYLLNMITFVGILDEIIKYSFILFTVLTLSGENAVKTSSSSFNDGFEDVVNNDSLENTVKAQPKSDSFDDGFSDTYNF